MEPLLFEQVFVRQFRNLSSLDFVPGPRFNVLFGDNGQGKSNLLEVLFYLGSLRSFRGAPTEELVQRGKESSTIAAKVSGPGLPHTLKVRLHADIGAGRKARELGLDDKRPRSTSVWLGVCPIVLFHPGDLELAQGGPDTRRALLDHMLEEIDPNYGATLSHYVKALRSRNRLLREDVPDRRAITSFDPILASAGSMLVQARSELVREIAPLAVQTTRMILGESIPIEIRYAPRVREDEIAEALARSLDKDIARGFTAEGPHADDVVLEVHARGAKHHASQGQQRTLVLALKVAELEVLARRLGRMPPLLLDDVSSELDRTRNERFFSKLAEMGGQVFLTTTHPELIRLCEGRVDWHIEQGSMTPR